MPGRETTAGHLRIGFQLKADDCRRPRAQEARRVTLLSGQQEEPAAVPFCRRSTKAFAITPVRRCCSEPPDLFPTSAGSVLACRSGLSESGSFGLPSDCAAPDSASSLPRSSRDPKPSTCCDHPCFPSSSSSGPSIPTFWVMQGNVKCTGKSFVNPPEALFPFETLDAQRVLSS